MSQTIVKEIGFSDVQPCTREISLLGFTAETEGSVVRLLYSFLEAKFLTKFNNKHNIRGQCLVRISLSRVTT